MYASRTITHAVGEARPYRLVVGKRRIREVEIRPARSTARRDAIAQSGGWR